jgi:microcystin degradation protein MlrC
MIRIASLGLFHEANTFSASVVGAHEMEAAGVLRGPEIVAAHRSGSSTMSGFLSLSECADVELVPLVMTTLVPGGPIAGDVFHVRTQEFVEALQDQGPFDGVLVALHGAAVAEDITDADGYLLQTIRDTVGNAVPIGASLDLHANISPRMCAAVDVLNTFRTNPHLDAREVAVEVGELVVRAARGEIRPVTVLEQVPAAINILRQNTDDHPMNALMKARDRAAGDPRVLSVSVVEGYPYADVEEMGMSVVAVGTDEQEARMVARTLAEQVWSMRYDFDATAPSPEEAVRMAAATSGPVLLLDVGDNIGGGASGESVCLLRAAQDAGFSDLVIIVTAPDAARTCHDAGIGAEVTLSLDSRVDEPGRRDTGRVLAVHDGTFAATEPVHAGFREFRAGLTAAVRMASGQTVVLTSRAVMPLTTNQLRVLGLEPAEFAAIVAKGVHSPLAGYRPHVNGIIVVDTPGITAANLRSFTYANRRRPMYPFEPEATFP